MPPWIIPYALFALIAGGITLFVTGQLRDLRGAEQLVFHNPWALLLLGACVLLFWVLFHLGQKR